jgi:uroporphyrinogen-III synthase
VIHQSQLPNVKMPQTCDLAGRGVLITRPAAQAGELCRLVEAAGGRAIRFPAIAIQPIGDSGPVRKLLTQPWDLILFVSHNAVTYALPLLPERRPPSKPRLGAIGAATAEALTAAGRAPDLVPEGRFDSESLLALRELEDLRAQRVLIVRGEGGRSLLGDTLVARGAHLSYAEVYRRTLPETDLAPLLARWREEVQLATATSGEILDNLLTLVGRVGRGLLLATPLVVVSERARKLAKQHGFARVELAEGASDPAVLAALCRTAKHKEGVENNLGRLG